MEEWKEYRLGDFMEFNPKISLKKDTIARKITMDQLAPHSRDIYSWTYEPYSGGAKFQNGDTIMARITPCLENGKHAFISLLDENEIAYGSTEYIVIRGRKGLSDNLFVYYLTHVPFFKDAAVKSMVGTSGRQRAQVDVLENLTMKLPSISEQKKIADILTKLDDKIALNKRINDNFVNAIIEVMLIWLLISLRNDNLEQQAQALFKSWFVDFEPFKNQPFVASELGLIPKGWRVVAFKDFIEASTEKASVDSYPEYSVTNNGIIPRETKFKKKLSKSTSKNKVLRKDNLVFGMSREILNWGIMEDEVGGVSSAYNIYAINKDIVSPTYLRLYMRARISDFNSLIGTAAREGQSLDKGHLLQKQVYVPTTAALQDFFGLFIPITEAQLNYRDESRRIAELRDTLLPRLMSGEFKIDEVNI
jgi:type I restriction enzyme S subunit